MSDTNKTREAQLAAEKAFKTADELLAYAKENGVELSDEDLERVSGGSGDNIVRCARCGSTNLVFDDELLLYGETYVCADCYFIG